MDGGGGELAGEDEAGGRCILHMEKYWAEKLRNGGGGGVWYVVVKEPFVKFKEGDGQGTPREWMVRVRHRSDWDILSSTSPLLPEPFRAAQTWRETSRSELKESGNVLYAQGVYWSAIEQYYLPTLHLLTCLLFGLKNCLTS
jgi:hypothetical protein